MYSALSPYAIHVSVGSLEEAIAAAKHGGFHGVEFGAEDVAGRIERQSVAAVLDLFHRAGIRPAAWSLPTDWREDEAAWQADLKKLPRQAKAAAALGAPRTMTWILPCSDVRPYEENLQFHIERFKPIAHILAEEGCSLGLEFIGPKTLRESQKYPFIHTLQGMLEMGAAIGPNVGLLLDCWHWYTSHGTLDELKRLKAEQVVYVHVNDAPTGIEIDSQLDNVRALPGETGVIDIVGFLQALQSIGYNGPVTPEPFKKELADLPSNEARLQVAGETMRAIFVKAGIADL